MSKTNFTKAEEALSDVLHKMSKEQLLKEADSAQGKLKAESLEEAKRIQIIAALQRTLKHLYRVDHDIYKKLGIKRKKLEELFAHAAQLSSEEWHLILEIKVKLIEYRKQMSPISGTNEQLVEEERHEHINKRFNVNKKWLPLK